MSQHDMNIANALFPAFRADINNALLALSSLSAGATAPATTFANMLWYDTASNRLEMRNEADDAWITIGVMNQTSDEFEVDFVGLKATQAEAEAGTSDAKIMTPLRTKQAIQDLSGWIRLDRRVASNDHELDFTAFDSAKFDAYKWIGANLIPSDELGQFLARVSTNGGTSFISTASYGRVGRGWRTNGSGGGSTLNVDADGNSTALHTISPNIPGSGAGEDGVSFELTMHMPHLAKRTTSHNQVGFFSVGNPLWIQHHEWGYYDQSTEVNGLRIGNLTAGTDIVSGIVDMYGLRNS